MQHMQRSRKVFFTVKKKSADLPHVIFLSIMAKFEHDILVGCAQHRILPIAGLKFKKYDITAKL
jgi:hypothetical protein